MLLFPVDEPQLFDAVQTDSNDNVLKVLVKSNTVETNWIWGAIKMNGLLLLILYNLWIDRNCIDEYIGTLINKYLYQGGMAIAVKKGEKYIDAGTLNGYKEAIRLVTHL